MKKGLYAVMAMASLFLATSTRVDASTNTGDMMRYYNTHKGTYLFTVNAAEIEKIKSFPYLKPQGATITTAQSGTKMYRFYHKATGRYVFTGKQDEIENMKKNGWVYEGFAFYSGGNVPITRLYHPKTGQHFYTGDPDEISAFIRKGWINEGIGFFAEGVTEVAFEEVLSYTAQKEDGISEKIVVYGEGSLITKLQYQIETSFVRTLTDVELEYIKPVLLRNVYQDEIFSRMRALSGVETTINITNDKIQIKYAYDFSKVLESEFLELRVKALSDIPYYEEDGRVYIDVDVYDILITNAGYERTVIK